MTPLNPYSAAVDPAVMALRQRPDVHREPRPAGPGLTCIDLQGIGQHRGAAPWARLARRFLAGSLLALCTLTALPVWAAAGTITHLSGLLTALKASGESKILAAKSDVDEGDTLVSETKTFARIKFTDGGNLVIRPNSRVKIDKYSYDPEKPENDNVAVGLLKGGLRSITGVVGKRSKNRHLTSTANATIGIRGTHFGLLLCQSEAECADQKSLSGQALTTGLHIDVLEGAIIASNSAGSQEIGAGQFGYVHTPLTLPVIIPPEQGNRVAVPPSMVSDTGSGNTVGRDGNDNMCVVK